MSIIPQDSPVRPRKAPTQARSRATIEAVLSAAAHILESAGLAGFNTNAVAERAGVSIGSLYQYFPNKDAILVALIERSATVFTENLEGLAGGLRNAEFADDLRQLLTQAVDWHAASPRLSAILDDEETRLAPHLDLESAKTRMRAVLAGIMGRHGLAPAAPEVEKVTHQLMLITKVIMEEESSQEEPDWPMAINRTVGAVMGYLSVARPAA